MQIGNDIIAYKNKRCIGKVNDEFFIQKILQPTEIEELKLQSNKEIFLWTLWTLKEAAYKLSCFLGNRKKFHALQFNVENPFEITNTFIQHLPSNQLKDNILNFHNYPTTIRFGDYFFYGKTLITHSYIHSIVVQEPENLKNAIVGIKEHQTKDKNDFSSEVRIFAIDKLLENNIKIHSFEKDIDGIPTVQFNNTKKYISLSHDQQFVSFGFIIK